jgi:AcrR family transcriptional regulator/DNA-binding MarR family transcriptional regulator
MAARGRASLARRAREPRAMARVRARRHGGAQVSEVQRARMLSSAVAVVTESGFERMSVARVTAGARVSRRTFYDLFEDREDCFLAALEDALSRLAEVLVPAYERGGQRRWRERVRAGLVVFLEFLDDEPALGSLLVVDSLKAGPKVLERRARVLGRVEAVIDEGRSEGKWAPPPLTAEGVVGAVLGVIAARVQEQSRREPLVGLCNALMAMIVLPYLGQAAAQKELARPVPTPARTVSGTVGSSRAAQARDPLEGLAMRLTYRTLRTLEAVARRPGASNREVGEMVEVPDQGQISKLLARLEGLGLLQNTGGGHSSGEPNAWRLTPRGVEVERATRTRQSTRLDERSRVGEA